MSFASTTTRNASRLFLTFYSQSIVVSNNRFGSFRRISTVIGRTASTTAMPAEATSTVPVTQYIKRRIDNVISSPEDKRVYRGLELTNGLKILLVSDPTTDKSAASLDVNVGHLCDPEDLPGLAHFCEHMLFLGTKKFPVENEYQKYLTTHGGNSNAYTSSDHTNYHFDVSPEFLDGAIDRFAQFFISPLFTESCTEREVLAVDSEHANNVQNDHWRLHQLECSLAKPDHAYRKFGTGNRKTLLDEAKAKKLEPRQELLKFHKKYYSSNLMALSVLGKESLDQLTEMVVPIFSQVPNKSLKVPEWQDHPYGREQVGFRINVVPVKDLRSLHVYFPIPDLNPLYKSNPGTYIGHLLGHEGKGSLLSELKRRGWVNGLSAGPSTSARGFGFFTIEFDLSEDGLNHIDDIVLLLFQFIRLLKLKGPQEWIHSEVEKINKMHFRFQDKGRPMSYVISTASNLHYYPINEVLFAPYMMSEYRPELVNALSDRLNVENFCYLVVSNTFAGKTKETEQWYGTPFSREKLNPSLKSQCVSCPIEKEFQLPKPNEFIPANFDLFKLDESAKGAPPEILRNDEKTRVWFKQDDEYLLPKCCVYFHFRSPVTYQSPLNNALSTLYSDLLRDSLTEYVYDAELAGLKYSLSNGRYGFSLTINGYNEKQKVLLEKLVERFASFEPDQKRFDVLKERYVRSLRNFAQEQPYHHASYYAGVILSEKVWTKDEVLKETENLTLDQLKAFRPKFFEAMHIEAYIHGNADKDEANKVVSTVENTLKRFVKYQPLYDSQLLKDRTVKLDDGKTYLFQAENKTHSNSAVEVLLQTGVEEPRLNMLNELLSQIINEPCYDQLRTKEQLGYIVFSGIRRLNGSQAQRFVVQGEKSPDFMDARLEAFLVDFEKQLVEMSSDEFEKHKTSLAAIRLEKPKKLASMAAKHWWEIASDLYHFNRDKEEVDVLKKFTKDDLLKFYSEYISANARNRTKLGIYVYSSKAKAEKTKEVNEKVSEIEDIANFKKYQPLYQLPKPYRNIPPAGFKAKM